MLQCIFTIKLTYRDLTFTGVAVTFIHNNDIPDSIPASITLLVNLVFATYSSTVITYRTFLVSFRLFSLLRHLHLRPAIPSVASSVKRLQTSISLILVYHWRKDFFVYLCKDILSSSVFSFSSWNTLCLSWWSSIRLSSPSLCHIFFPHIPLPSFPLPYLSSRDRRSVSSTLFQQLFVVFPISGFLQPTMGVFSLMSLFIPQS